MSWRERTHDLETVGDNGGGGHLVQVYSLYISRLEMSLSPGVWQLEVSKLSCPLPLLWNLDQWESIYIDRMLVCPCSSSDLRSNYDASDRHAAGLG